MPEGWKIRKSIARLIENFKSLPEGWNKRTFYP